MRSNNVTVISQLESNDLIKYYRNDSQFIVRVLADNGSYVGAGEEVTFNINGVFYTRVTNETGYVTLNINLNP
ncbi:MAG: carboxypeptidase regulatory-like domain-containing protein, partial [Methanobrevibacter sp.]|nr:carboxypeptidase regulatory-like domain-containing protein [Methanobrevibacter sp.]